MVGPDEAGAQVTSTTAGTAARRRGFSPLRDLPATAWLMAAVLALVLHSWLPAPQWLVIHLVVLGAASHSILVWSQYFADTLLKSPSSAADRRRHSVRVALLNVGALVVMSGVLAAHPAWVWLGAAFVAGAAGWHAVSLLLQLRGGLSPRFRIVVRYYIAAAALLPVGALLGALLASGGDADDPARLVVSHVVTNVLGWLGITVAGTLLTLWPTMLRTRLAEGSERAAARALPWLVVGVLATDVLALSGAQLGSAVALVGYLVGIAILAVPFARTLRAKPATDVATYSVVAGAGWFVLVVAFLVAALATSLGWEEVEQRLSLVAPAVAAGFAVQMLIGALSYLLPVALGGGPSVSRLTNAAMGRGGPLRVALLNGGLLLALLPAPAAVGTVGWAMVGASVLAFLVLVPVASRAARRAKAASPGGTAPRTSAARTEALAGERRRASAVVGVAVVAVATAAAVSLSPAGPGADDAMALVPTGSTTTVTVVARGMRFYPDQISVPAGDRLVVLVRNDDVDTSHDLVFPGGASSGRLAPGARGRVDVGVVASPVDAWCSVPGHRQMGMVLHVVTTGSAALVHEMPGMSSPDSSTAEVPAGGESRIDLDQRPDASFSSYPAALRPATGGTVHRVTLEVQETVREVAPGVRQKLWTYNGTAPGPLLHGRVGDTFDVTVVNRSSMAHSIDFHAGQVAPDAVMRTIEPGGTRHYVFRATHAGVWMYHCSTMPMSVHIANGMFGAVIIDPPGLPPVGREYVLLQSELYLGAPGAEVDADKVVQERPDLVVFNGYANQYVARPLTARVGERVRIWVLDAGPNRPSSFHVVGGQFDTVYSEGAYLLRRGAGASQALALSPSQGGFVELTFLEPGHYPFVSHVMVDAERGARGMVVVSP